MSCSVQVLEDKAVSISQVHKNLSEFLKKKHIQEGLSDDDYTRLERIQKALEMDTNAGTESAPAD